MQWRAYSVLAYGLLLLVGGIIGHVKANSIPSLIMGCGSAALMLVSAWSMLLNQATGRKVALAVASLLLAFFCYRLFLTGKLMPAGLMAAASLAIVIALVSERQAVVACKESD